MPIRLFDPEGQRVAHPKKHKSPFLRGVKGPGSIGEEGTANAQTFAEPSLSSSSANANASSSRTALPPLPETPRLKRHYTKRGTGEIAMRKAREAAEAKAKAAQATAAAAIPAIIPMAIPSHPTRAHPPAQVHHRKRKIDDRSASAAAGGPAYMRDAKIEVLPSETGESSLMYEFELRD